LEYGAITSIALGVESRQLRDFSYILCSGLALNTVYKIKGKNSIDTLIVYYADIESKMIFGLSDKEVLHLTLEELNKIGIGELTEKEVLFKAVKRWRTGGTIVSTKSYGTWSEEMIKPSKRVFLAGDYTWPEMPYGMEAAVNSGKAAARGIRALLSTAQ
jgi:hypothetical protein